MKKISEYPDAVRIIFLDFDGVMLSMDYLHATGKYDSFDPNCCVILNKLLNQFPDARIVVSSSWRVGMTIDKLKALFADHGIDPNRVIGYTPWINTYLERGAEIQDWLDRHHKVDCVVKDFMIIDDNVDDILSHFNRQFVVHTDEDKGLTHYDLDDIVQRWSPNDGRTKIL